MNEVPWYVWSLVALISFPFLLPVFCYVVSFYIDIYWFIFRKDDARKRH